ncbi:MAG: VOC family protein [Phenylobacterium sp.]
MTDVRPTFIPTVIYRDPMAALRWLEAAFGFETSILVTDGEGHVGHAEMAFRGGAVGVAGEWSGPQIGGVKMTSPANLPGDVATQFLWVTLDEGIDAHCERARAAGARIVQAPEDQFYGARTYRAHDLDGHVWCFSQEVRQVSVADQEAATGLKFAQSLKEA